jgi:hypothetical protein
LGLEIDGGDTELGDALEPFDEGAKEGVKIGRMTVEEGYREEVLELVANLGREVLDLEEDRPDGMGAGGRSQAARLGTASREGEGVQAKQEEM